MCHGLFPWVFEILCSFDKFYKTYQVGVTFLAQKNSETPRNTRNSEFLKPFAKMSVLSKLNPRDKILSFTNSKHRNFKKLTERTGS